MVRRRRFLQTFGLGCTATLAGCSTFSDGDPGPENTTTDGDPGGEPPRTTTETTTEPEPYTTELIRMTAGGDDLGPENDQGHFLYSEVSGDFDVAVHAVALEGTTGWEKAGVMVRESLDATARHVMARRNQDGETVYDASPSSVQWRAASGENTTARLGPMAEWLRVKRSGDTIEVFGSMTGENWERFYEFGADGLSLSEDVYVGLAATGMEEYGPGTVTATFKDVSGVEPTENVDLGEPDHEGSVERRSDIPVIATAEAETAPEQMAFRANCYLPDGVESTECHFEYRETSADEWETTDSVTVSESRSFSVSAPAETRRIYQYRAVSDVSVDEEFAAFDPSAGATVFRSTPSPDPADESDAGLSAGISEFGPDDGFADPAPWLDDDTPIITITEPDMERLDRVFKTPHERLVVFETSGTIDMKAEQWSIRDDKCYIAGQTAPSPGVTFIRGSFQVAADDCVVQHIRVRAGIADQEQGYAPTGLHTQDRSENNVIDHCTVTWAIDENLTVGGPSANTTLTNNIAAEGLANATHPKGVHSYGSLIKDGAKNVAMFGNVWAHNIGRNPRLKTGTESVVVNNVMYHFDEATKLDDDTIASIVGNAYLRVDVGDANVEGGNAYLEDNITDPETPMTSGVTEYAGPPLMPVSAAPISSGEVIEHNLANAGARPADRDDHDARIIEQVRERTGEIIDSETEVGGYDELAVTTRELSLPDSETKAWLRERSAEVEQSG